MARKPFVLSVLLYSTTLVLLFSALLTESWVEDSHNNGVIGKTSKIKAVLSIAFLFCTLGLVMLAWRMYGKVGTVAKYIAIVCSAVTGVLGVVAVYSYSIDVPLEEGFYYGFGYYTTAAAGVNAWVPCGLMIVHELQVHEKINRDRLSDRQWRLVLSYAIFFVYIELGGACYAYIEGWPAANAFMFCIVTVASIGYGSVGGDNQCNAGFIDRGGRPVTDQGKIFTFFYAPIGFGLIGWFIKSVWDALIVEVEKTVHRRRKTVADLVKGRELQLITPAGRLFYGTFGTLTMLFLGGLLWSFSEGWSYFNAFWFSFVTLTTIGYGDFVPNPNHYYFYFVYLMLGLGCVTYFVSAISYYVVGSIDRKVARGNLNGGQTVMQALTRLGKDMHNILPELPPDQAAIFINAFQNLRTVAIEDQRSRYGDVPMEEDDDSLVRHTIVMDELPPGSGRKEAGDMGIGYYQPPPLSNNGTTVSAKKGATTASADNAMSRLVPNGGFFGGDRSSVNSQQSAQSDIGAGAGGIIRGGVGGSNAGGGGGVDKTSPADKNAAIGGAAVSIQSQAQLFDRTPSGSVNRNSLLMGTPVLK